MTGNNTKLRAVTLAALMVLSVMVGSIAFTGAAAATNHTDANSRDALSYDANVTTGANHWHGQDLYFAAADENEAGDTYELYEVTTDGNTLESQFVLNENASSVINTGSLTAGSSYAIQDDDGNWITVSDANDGVESDDTATDASDAAFTVIEQSFAADFGSDSVDNAGGDSDTNTDVSIDTNRGQSRVHVTWDGAADASTIASAFNNNGNGFDAAVGGDDYVVLRGVQSGTTAVNFSGVDADAYNFTFTVEDTGVSSEDSLTVNDVGEGDASFEENIVSQHRGDVAKITVNLENTDSAYVNIGSKSVNYLANFKVTDGDNDGQVTVYFNTFETANGTTSDTVYVASSSDDSVSDINSVVNVSNPIAAGDYDFNVTTGSPASGTESDVGTLIVEERSTNGANSGLVKGSTKPSNLDAADVPDAVTERNTVAQGDYAVTTFDISGIEGYFNVSNLDGSESANGLSIVATEQNPEPNTEADSYVLNDANAEFVTDLENDTFYVFWDTSVLSFDSARNYQVLLNIDHENNSLVSEEDESAAAAFTIESESVSLNGGNALSVQKQESDISGSTNLAPGTELTVRARATGDNPFLKSQKVEVQADGSFAASLDFSDVPVGTAFTAKVQGYDNTQIDGEVVEEQTTTTTTTTTTDDTTTTTTAEETTTTTAEETTTTTTTEPPETTTTTEGETPGFGVVVGLIAMLGAALLALRREN